MDLSGIFPPLTTPFENGDACPGRLAENIARYEAQGFAGYLVLGSTGEAAFLEEAEKVALLRAARAAIPARRRLLAGVGLESTRGTVRLARAAADCGADAVLVLTPHYFRSRMTAEVLLRHFEAVAEASPAPVLLYNVPAFTGVVIPPAVVASLAAHPNVVGLKDSSGDLGWMLDVLSRVPPAFQVLCGSAFAIQPALAAGAVGGILAAADALPEPFVALYESYRAGDDATAQSLQKRVMAAARTLVSGYGIAGIKAAMDLRGLHGGVPRPPLGPSSEADRAAIRTLLEDLVAQGLLPSVPL